MFPIIASNISKEENDDQSDEKSNEFHSKPPKRDILLYMFFISRENIHLW